MVPVVKGKTLHQGTAVSVVTQILDSLDLERDEKSIAKQAYSWKAMISHIREIYRETRKTEKLGLIYELAAGPATYRHSAHSCILLHMFVYIFVYI